MGAVDAIKGVGELVKQVHDAELKTEMLKRVIDAQTECAALLEKNAELREELSQTKARLDAATKQTVTREKLTFADDVYYLNDELGYRPICPACFEAKGLTVPLKRRSPGTAPNCPLCRSFFHNAKMQ